MIIVLNYAQAPCDILAVHGQIPLGHGALLLQAFPDALLIGLQGDAPFFVEPPGGGICHIRMLPYLPYYNVVHPALPHFRSLLPVSRFHPCAPAPFPGRPEVLRTAGGGFRRARNRIPIIQEKPGFFNTGFFIRGFHPPPGILWAYSACTCGTFG